ncbi:unnamed protein product [Effrenium voratum]|uniref:DSBA-like thioredoxin domain-containing protein n=1 Tax=Effrenium voratum TaxID=2562239 RepID=A0AA36JFB6_9DINO|nr:unnamed protein product [Effrenium voratum]CAJ1403948.1 unnamed protein product [Effrenium voratum]CAJ1414963.1 unnamed protein product [Effrenium voratum]
METLADEAIDFTVTRLPFFLRPELPGINKSLGDGTAGTWRVEDSPGTWGQQMDLYTKKHPEKFGADGQAPDARFGISWQAAEVGLKFSFGQPMSNSMDALRLLVKVQREHSPAVREAFFEIVSRKYFTEGRPLADHQMLLEAAKEAEVPTEGLLEWLRSGDGTFEIQRTYAEIFFGWGYTSVPVTLVSCEGLDQHIQGSQNLEAYLQVFRRILEEPLASKTPEQKLPIWEKYSRVAQATGTANGKDFSVEARDIFFGETALNLRQKAKGARPG